MIVSIIVAMGHNRVIGLNNQLPWLLPEDLKFFKATTMGKPIIMGRKTFESIGRALPGRTNIVITRNKKWKQDGVKVVHTMEKALKIAAKGKTEEIMVIGGAQIYAEALDHAQRLYITEVDIDVEGDAFFPEKSGHWSEVSRIAHPSEAEKPAYAFVKLER